MQLKITFGGQYILSQTSFAGDNFVLVANMFLADMIFYLNGLSHEIDFKTFDQKITELRDVRLVFETVPWSQVFCMWHCGALTPLYDTYRVLPKFR